MADEFINKMDQNDESILKRSLLETKDLIQIKIVSIETMQSELKCLIETLTSDIEQMRLDITVIQSISEEDKLKNDNAKSGKNTVTKWNTIVGMRRAINDSLQLVNNFYSTHKEYEAVKIRYIKESDDMSLSAYRMMMVDLKKLNDFSDDYKDMMFDVTKLINTAVSKIKDIDINTDKNTKSQKVIAAQKELENLFNSNEDSSYDL